MLCGLKNGGKAPVCRMRVAARKHEYVDAIGGGFDATPCGKIRAST